LRVGRVQRMDGARGGSLRAEACTLERHAEAILREAIDGYDRASGPDSPDTLRAVGTLATLLDEAGMQSESRPLHMRLIAAISSKDDASPLELRGASLSCLLIGNYQLAESLLRRVLNSGFEIASTHCHLARVMMLTSREPDARIQIEQAWKYLETAEQLRRAQGSLVSSLVWVHEIKVGATACERPKSLRIDQRGCNNARQGWHWLRARTSAFQIV
jgi:hypothetical protein